MRSITTFISITVLKNITAEYDFKRSLNLFEELGSERIQKRTLDISCFLILSLSR